MSEEEQLTFFEKFKQQKMKAWYPIPTLTKTITIFLILGVIFIGLGVPMFIFSNELTQIRIRYDDVCVPGAANCIIPLTVSQTIVGPVFVYYELNNFFQNHRLYAKSINYEQLQGQSVSPSVLQTSCAPIVYNRDLYVSVSVSGAALNMSDFALPCGMVAYTIFNDSFMLQNSASLANILIENKGIAWPSDIARYSQVNSNLAWLDLKSQRVMNWLRIAALSDFRKAWGRIALDLPAANYNLIINNQYNLNQFDVKKYFILTNTNILGSKNLFIPLLYISAGILCFVASVVFIVRKIKKDKNF